MREPTRLQGVPAAPGIAIGPWARVGRAPLPTGGRIDPADADAEIGRARSAAATAAEELDALAAQVRDGGHEDEAAIFGAAAEMARDPALLDGAAEHIRGAGMDAVAAVPAAAGSIADLLAGLGDELLAARATDVRDVGDRIARILAGLPREATLDVASIVVAEDLSPALTATMPRERLLGIVLTGSSPTAHAAILSRAYGIPAVVGTTGVIEAVEAAGAGAVVGVDGTSGEVVIAPDDATLADFQARAERAREAGDRDRAEAHEPAVTRDGTEVAIVANIGSPAEAAGAVALGARGVGLFRTEFLFMERATPPTEDEQAAAYTEAVATFDGDPVTIRLLDVGGDKPIPYLPIAPEENPFLGVRALRLAVDRPEIFVTQLRACYRAAVAGPVKVMAPMVADARDARRLLELAAQARDGLTAEGVSIGDVQIGVMLEIPSAIIVADSYFGDLAFASLGTNDLTQYTLAVDRGNPALESYRDSLHPAVLRLIRASVEAADRSGTELSVCGEMAGDPASALALVGLGIRALSMSASSLPAVKRAIRATDLATLESAARAALDDASAVQVRARFAEILPA